jgi:hypothetical protein
MTLDPITSLRALALPLLAILALTLSASADSGSGPATATTAAGSTASSEEAAPCGCGGPKSYYLKKYGTIKPPAFQSQTGGQPQATAPATAPVNSSSTGNGG